MPPLCIHIFAPPGLRGPLGIVHNPRPFIKGIATIPSLGIASITSKDKTWNSLLKAPRTRQGGNFKP